MPAFRRLEVQLPKFDAVLKQRLAERQQRKQTMQGEAIDSEYDITALNDQRLALQGSVAVRCQAARARGLDIGIRVGPPEPEDLEDMAEVADSRRVLRPVAAYLRELFAAEDGEGGTGLCAAASAVQANLGALGVFVDEFPKELYTGQASSVSSGPGPAWRARPRCFSRLHLIPILRTREYG